MSRSHISRLVLGSMLYLALAAAITMAVPAPAQTFSVIWNAPGQPGPGNNLLGLVLGPDGNFYGGSWFGGTNNRGEIYKVTPTGVYSAVYNIKTTDPDCAYSLQLLATNGNFYGTASQCSNGLIFEVTPTGTFNVLYTFSGTDGSDPSLAFEGPNGQLYGFTSSEGPSNGGTFFEITTSGVLTTLYSFADGGTVWEPQAMILGKDNNYYGVGYDSNGSDGGVFKLTPSGTLTVLHTFTNNPDGAGPTALTQGTDEKLYGVTQYGGASLGTIYSISPSGNNYMILHTVNFGDDEGEDPTASLIQGSDGNFYSTMTSCDEFGCTFPQNVYEITPAGAFSVLGEFTDDNGYMPMGGEAYWGVIQDPNGTFYGVADTGGMFGEGTIFSVNKNLKAFAKLSTALAKEAAVVGIFGQGFGSSSVVKFGGVQATTIARIGSTFIDATVPAGALTGIVTVTTGTTTLSSWQTFDVIPTFKTFAPTSGPVGTPVTLTGTGLMQTRKVTFNGTSASFTVNSDTQVTATVPTGATTGKIDITTLGGGAISSTVFTVN